MTDATNRLPPEQATMTMDQAENALESMLERYESVRGQITMTPEGVDFPDFAGVQRYARMLVEAGCVPTVKDDHPKAQLARATVCILLGRRVGMTPEQAVQSMYVINGRPTMFGDMPLAICRQHPKWVEAGFCEWYEVDGKPFTIAGPDGKPRLAEPPPEAFKKDDTAACCQVQREGGHQVVSRFSMAHAKTAGLLGRNAALYTGYAQRMLKFRARGYPLRDIFGDALKGIGIRELQDEHEAANEPRKPPVAVDPIAEELGLTKPTNGNGEHKTEAAAQEMAAEQKPRRKRTNPTTAPHAATAQVSSDTAAVGPHVAQADQPATAEALDRLKAAEKMCGDELLLQDLCLQHGIDGNNLTNANAEFLIAELKKEASIQ